MRSLWIGLFFFLFVNSIALAQAVPPAVQKVTTTQLPTNLSGNGNLQVNINESTATIPISAVALPMPTGAATAANQVTGNSSLATIVTNTAGSATAANQTNGTQQTQIVQGGNTLSVTVGGAIKVDGSAVTQPVSGTVTANAGSGTFTVAGLVTANQGGTWNIANITGTISLPTGAATAANQATEITNLQSIVTQLQNVQPRSVRADTDVNQTNSLHVKTSGSDVVAIQGGNSSPVNVSAPGGLSVVQSTGSNLHVTVDSGTVTTVPSGTQTVAGVVTANAGTGTFTVGGTVNSNLRDGSGNSITSTGGALNVNFVNSLSSVSQGSPNTLANAWPVKPTDGTNSQSFTASGEAKTIVDNTLSVQTTGGNTVAITAAALPLPSGAATEATLSALNGKVVTTVNGIKVDGSAVTQPISGTVAISTVNGGALTSSINGGHTGLDVNLINTTVAIQGGNSTAVKVDGSAVTQPVSVASLPLPTGAATEATLSALNTKVSTTANGIKVDGSSVTQPVSGTVSVSGTVNVNDLTEGPVSPGTAATKSTMLGGQFNTTLPTVGNTQQVALQVDSSGRLLVNGSGATQPVSGTITANIGTPGSLALDSSVQAINGKLTNTGSGIKVDGSSVTQPVSGTVTATQGTPGSLANGWPVEITDGISKAAVKPSSTAPLASDPSLVVAISPNSPISVTSSPPTNTIATGAITAACPTGSGCSASSVISIITSGFTTMGFETHGTWTAVIQADVSYDAICETSPLLARWFQTAFVDVNDSEAKYENSFDSTDNFHPWVMNVSSAVCARLRASSYTSGTVSATLTSGVGSAQTWAVSVGNIASGDGDLGNPIKIGGVFNSSLPTFSDGARADIQVDSNGRVIIRPLTAADVVTANQGGTWNINNVSGTISLPTNAAQETGGHLASIDTKLTTTVNGLKVDGSAVTQPVSGTVTANAGTGTFTVGQATAANLNATVVQSTGSNLHVDVDNFPATQTVAGTVTSNQGTSPWIVRPSDGSNNLSKLFDLDTSGSTHEYNVGVGLRQSANGGSVEAGVAAHPLRIDPTGTTTQPVSGTVTANIGTTNGLALDTTVSGLQVSQGSTTSGQKGTLAQGAVTTSAPSYTTAQTSPLSLTTAGALRTDSSATTQPVSGTVTANQGGTWNINNISGTVSLPTGAATSANQTNGNQQTQIVQGGNVATVTASNALKVDGSAVTQPVSGTVTANAGTGTFAVAGTVASGATDSGNPVKEGFVFNTTQPTVTTGQRVDAQGTSRGALIVATGADNFNINNVSGTVSLPTGASTAANQTNGTQKNQIVDGSGNVYGPTTTISSVNYLPVIQSSSATPGSAVPSRATLVAGSDGTNAQTISTDTTGKININNISGTVSLPTGAATAANQTTIDTDIKGTQPRNITQFGGNSVVTGTGASGVGIPRVTVSNDSTVTANAGTGTFTVGQATASNLNAQVVGSVASGSSDSGNPVKIGGVFNTTQPTLTNGQRGDVQLTARGAQVVAGASDVGATPVNPPVGVSGVDGGGLKRAFLTDTSGNLGVIGSVASGASDSGNPVKIGAKFNSTLPTVTNGQRVDLQANQFGALVTMPRFKYSHVAGAATTTIKSGSGVIHTLCYNNDVGTTTVYDNTAGSGTVIAVINPSVGSSAQIFCQFYDVEFSTGLTIVTTNANQDTTVSFY